MQRVPPNMLYESQLVAFASSPAFHLSKPHRLVKIIVNSRWTNVEKNGYTILR